MRENFATALKAVLVYEGGKDDDPRDPGGRTNQGVIQRVYAAYRLRKRLPPRDVFLMENVERDEIYRTQYADKVNFNDLPPGIDFVMFNGAVNCGPSQQIKWAQRALGLTANGVLGDVTMQRIIDHPDHDILAAQMLDRQRAFYRALKTFPTFGRGWLARTDSVQKKAQAMAMGSVGPTVVFIPNGNKKATMLDAKPLPAMGPAAALSSGGTVSTTLTGAQQTLEPFATNEFVAHVLTAILIASIAATAIGFAWSYYAKTRRAELEDVLDLVPLPGDADNDNVPDDVLREYADPTARGTETGNIAPGHVTQSGRVAGDTEVRVNSAPRRGEAA